MQRNIFVSSWQHSVNQQEPAESSLGHTENMAVSRDHYYNLASDLEKERIDAAIALIGELNTADQAEEWQYALTRLIKGLGSSRGSSRIGFSTCLTEIINIRHSGGHLTVEKLIQLINTHTAVSASMNGKEERAMLFGKLFGLQCLVNMNAGIFSTQTINPDDFKLIVTNLVSLSCVKSWIREPSLFTLYRFIKDVSAKLAQQEFTFVLSQLDENKLTLTTEGLAIYLIIPDIPPTLSLSNKHWEDNNPLLRKNIALLSKVLKDISSGDESDEKKQKGSWQPRLHFVWPILIQRLIDVNDAGRQDDLEDEDEQETNSKKRSKSKSDQKKSKKAKKNNGSSVQSSEFTTVSEFWRTIIDEGFFSEKASHERKYWGFEIFQIFLTLLPAKQIDLIFTKNFLRTLINQSSDSNRMLNKIAKKSLQQVIEVCKNEDAKSLPILKKLLSDDIGSLNFDRITKTKTIENLIQNTKDNKGWAAYLLDNLNVESEEFNEKSFKWTVDQLLHLIRYKKTEISQNINNNDIEWIDLILQSMVELTFFKNESISKEVNEFLKERLNSILADVLIIERTDGITWSYKTLTFINNFIQKDHLVQIFEFDENLTEIKDKANKILKKIRLKRSSSKHADNSKLMIFELLISMITIQLYSGEEESFNTLQEMIDYYYELKQQSLARDENDDEERNSNSIVGIVEILLNFLSQKSALLKKLSLIVWENFCDKIELSSLELLYNVIEARENKEGQAALFEGEDEFVEDDEEEEEEEESESESEEEEDEEQDEEEETPAELNEVEKKTNQALAEALQITNYDGEVQLLSDDEDDEFSDESMDDEQMMAIDGQLSKIFKQRRDALEQIPSGNKRKIEVQNARENIILFKHRIIDLLEIYIKKCSDNELIVTMIKPLLKGLKLTLDKSLGVKIHKLIKNKICKVKFTKESFKLVNEEYLIENLNFIKTDILRNSNSIDFNLSCSQSIIFLSKNLLLFNDDNIDLIIDFYNELLKEWFKRKNTKLTSSIFFDFINWLNSKK